jgi:hypothetical protein
VLKALDENKQLMKLLAASMLDVSTLKEMLGENCLHHYSIAATKA